MSQFIEIFRYTGHQMEKKGSLFALMFFGMGIGALFTYFIIGWCSNAVATVRSLREGYVPVNYLD
jgi:ATP-binding cassette subfamily B (MDR/TAP) protein 1